MAIVIGALAAGGWVADLPLLTRFVAGLPPQRPITTAMVTLTGVALLCCLPVAPAARRLGRLGAFASAALAGAVLLEHARMAELGLTRFGHHVVGLPGAETAVALLLLSLATATVRAAQPGTVRLGLLAGLAGTWIGLDALLGYLFQAPSLYVIDPVGQQERMSLPTAFAVVALGVGVQAARPDRGLARLALLDDLGGEHVRTWLTVTAFVPPVALLVATARWSGLIGPAELAAFTVALLLGAHAALAYGTGRHLSEAVVARDRAAAATAAALDALRRSEAQLRSLVADAPEGILVSDADGTCIEANEAACRILGRPREVVLGRRAADFLCSEDAAAMEARLPTLRPGDIDRAEVRVRRADGGWSHVELTRGLLPDGRRQAVLRDVTDRILARDAEARMAELELARRAEVQLLFDIDGAINAAVADLPNGGLAAVLETIAERARGATGAHLAAVGIGTEPGEPFRTWVVAEAGAARHADDAPSPSALGFGGHDVVVQLDDPASDPVLRHLAAGSSTSSGLLAIPIRHAGRRSGMLYLADKADGTPFDADDRRLLHAIADRAGQALEIARLYEAEAHGHAWLEAVVDQLPELVVIADADGAPLRHNHLARALLRDDEDPARRSRLDLHTPDGRRLDVAEHPEVRAARDGVCLTGVELAVVGPDGGTTPVLASASPVQRDGHVRGAVAVLQDIGALKELEHLREAWGAVVAHDLRQPATTIGLTTDLLLRRAAELPDGVRDRLKAIGASARQLRRIVDDLLDVSRVESRQLDLRPVVTDLRALAVRVAGHLELAREGHAVRVPDGDAVFAWADPGRVEQVLTNLLTNADKYGAPDAPIEVGLVVDGVEVTVSVVNQGDGLDPSEVPKLFARFARTDGARRSKHGGLGLGLYISHGIVEAHGGRMWVESEPGGTTTFRFTLRRCDPPALPLAPPDASP